ITVGGVTTQCYLSVNLDAVGNLTGTLNMHTLPGSATGTLSLENNTLALHLHATGPASLNIESDIDAQLVGTSQFVGTATLANQTSPCTMDVSAGGPLAVTFDVDLVVSGTNVTGSGMASSCSVSLPVNVTGSNTATNCALHIVGANM